MASKRNILELDNAFSNIIDEEKKPSRNRVIDNYKREFLIRDGYMKTLEESFPSNEMSFLRHIAKYRDKWMYVLSSIYPCKYPVFGDEEKKIIFSSTGINPKELEKSISQVVLPKGVDKKANFTPIYTTLLMILNYYLRKKNIEKFNMVARYFSYSMYWSIFTRSFPIPPNEGIMEYTINRINNKFIIKQLGSVDNLLFYCTIGSLRNNADLLEEFFDYAICYITDGVKGAIGGKIIGIATEFYKDWENREIILKGDDSKNVDSRSVAYDTEVFANQYTSKFFSDDPRQDLVKFAATICNVSVGELLSTLRVLITDSRIDEVKEFYQCLFHSYFSEHDSDPDLRDKKKFCNRMMAIYKRGHSKNKNDIEIKRLLNKWLNEGSVTFQRTNREPTQNDYRKAVYVYFVLLVATSTS